MQIVVQIRNGGFTGTAVDSHLIQRRLAAALDKLPITKVIMGWSTDATSYRDAAEWLAARGVDLYLWLPVFSELGSLANCSPVIGCFGDAPRKYQLDEDENFEFYCPNNPTNTDAVIDVWRSQFASIGFTGVFLDKIRYPSFVNGLDGGLTCFCARCRQTFTDAGVDVDKLLRDVDSLKTMGTPFGASQYADGHYRFDDDNWQRYFDTRCDIVFESLKSICTTLRADGCSIGLDVFAPFMSHFVGQDIRRLSTLADFVKPMMYAATAAPAGLPFEMGAMLNEIGVPRQPYCEIIGCDDSQTPFDLTFCARQIEQLRAHTRSPILPGIEINRIDGIAPTDTEYITRCLDTYSQSDGFVLSWNLLDAPDAHIDAVSKWLSRAG